MADHRAHHRRTLAAPDSNPDPTLKIQSNPKSKNTHPDHKTASTHHKHKHFSMTLSSQLSRLNLYGHRTQKPNNPRGMDIRLQAKAMTVSADASSFSLIKPHKSRAQEVPKDKLGKSAMEVDGKNKLVQERVGGQKVKQKEAKKDEYSSQKEPRVSVSLGRRRSFSGSQVELTDILASSGVKIVSVDMPTFMQIHAVDCARKTHDSLEKFTAKALALTLKKEFDGVYGPAWHCIVGKSFGSFVTHSVGSFLYLSMDQKLYILLFKTTVQRAD